ncbi:CMGC family protein kinase [Tritrichomonas foetus]|uniref:CMGC family protein kinase n=1 Tax=Tritrichomonas foetus TaxID=1144522 RepID=A0A1J4KUF0_9EUKA|nr:CMGC family protein kinase [Tritrichomonas foetus]|eukprot:OHT13388.1 CMGC family protein kinase [Tritrichomonas foetus]
MKRFESLGVLGDGAFGVVTKCRDKESGEIVAIKKMKQRYSTFDECLQEKEVKSLRKIKHQNVERLLQVFRENEYLHLVFELLGDSLLKTINKKNGAPFLESEIRSIMSQLLTGLAYCHRQGFFHRDIKPDNLLWKGDILKIADFGLAREIRSRPPYTEYVSTRWYRAPEIILRAPNYNSPVDIWASGCIMAELYMGHPIFPGNSEQDQMYKIVNVLGAPNTHIWPEFGRLVSKTSYRFPQVTSTPLATLMPNASPEAIDLMTQLFQYDPARRPSASQALQHPFFTQTGSASARVSVTSTDKIDATPKIASETQKSVDIALSQIPNITSKTQPVSKSALERPPKSFFEEPLPNDLDDLLKELL